MKAFQLRAYDGPDAPALVDVPAPEPALGQLLVDVSAIGINFPDLLMTRGQYQLKPPLPAIPGCEVAGTVAWAPGGSGWQAGDRIACFVWQGGYAERVAVPLNYAAPVPDTVELITAAGMVVNYQTALFALDRRGRVRAGDVVVVLGAAGGIGAAAVQVATGLGARVIAGVKDDQLETAHAAGATETIVLRPGFAAVIREMTGGNGADIVIDPVGDWLFDEAVRTLAPEGRVVVVGFAAGAIPAVKVNRLLLRNINVVGAAFGAFLDLDASLMRRQAEVLDGMVLSGVARPHITAIYPFRDLPEALSRLRNKGIRGKAVVRLVGGS